MPQNVFDDFKLKMNLKRRARHSMQQRKIRAVRHKASLSDHTDLFMKPMPEKARQSREKPAELSLYLNWSFVIS